MRLGCEVAKWRSGAGFVLMLLLLLQAAFVVDRGETAVDEERPYAVHLPIVADGREPPKSGIAFSSHRDAQERVDLLEGTVHYWRGWQVGNSLPGDRWGLEFTPSLWCDFYWHRQHSQGMFRPQMQVLDLLGPDYDGYLLFLNEPDLAYYGMSGQCAMSPRQAAHMYVHIKSFMPKVKLVGPGISHVDYLNGYRWLGEWFDFVVHYTGETPQMHAWDVHTYLRTGPPLAPYDALQAWLAARGVYDPIFWITEYGSCDPHRLRYMMDSFEADPRIRRYYIYEQFGATWDGDGRCILLFYEDERPIKLTLLGRVFVRGLAALGERTAAGWQQPVMD